MGLRDEFDQVIGLAKEVVSDRAAEKKKAEEERKTVPLICPYCGASSKFLWQEGMLPKCPNCGATFDADDEQIRKIVSDHDLAVEAERKAQEIRALESAKTKAKIRRYVIIAVIVIVLIIVAMIVAKASGGSFHMGGDATFDFHVDAGGAAKK